MRLGSYHLDQSYHCQVGPGAQLTPGPTNSTAAGESEMLLVSGAGAAPSLLSPAPRPSRGMGAPSGGEWDGDEVRLRVVSDQIPISLTKPQGWHVAFALVWLEEGEYSPKGVLLLGNTFLGGNRLYLRLFESVPVGDLGVETSTTPRGDM